MSADPAEEAAAEGGAGRASRRTTLLKLAVTLVLYALVFVKIDRDDGIGAVWERLRTAHLLPVVLGVVVYASGQWLSALSGISCCGRSVWPFRT